MTTPETKHRSLQLGLHADLAKIDLIGLSTLFVRETRGHAEAEATNHVARTDGGDAHRHAQLIQRDMFVQTSLREPALSSACQAGLVNDPNDVRSVGIYRLWRDGGFDGGAVLTGVIADLRGVRAVVWTVAALTAASGLLVAIRMYETNVPWGRP